MYLQNDREALQRSIIAAERSTVALGNDVSVLQSLSTSSGSVHGPSSPGGAERNGSVKSTYGDRPQSPTKEDKPLLCDKEDKVIPEERTVPFPSGGTSRS
jgi:hypothetical protein